ncbi:uncharacterized protein LOC114132149 [Aphis gossypii]|uniref:Uncharacterized protein n=1 Tax=Aphis gossypii TaxID=80765 RepID=A0A9P0JDD0_APHGO|nr:uncharacterized protein LOC114132149 [Aphis gossypii]CAH1732680.1 unnamed protein product [Aphis gossypii]
MQQTRQINESLITVWKGCRVIGLINMIYLPIEIVGLAIHAYYMGFNFNDYFGNPGTLKTISEYAVIAGIIIMIMLAIMLLHSNYALFRNSANNEIKVYIWLVQHTMVFFICFVICIIVVIFEYEGVFSFCFAPNLVIVLLIEIIIVKKLYREITSAREGNMIYQP